MKREIVRVNWDDTKTIAKAERKKTRLENAGWRLEKTVAEGNSASMYYVRGHDYDNYPM